MAEDKSEKRPIIIKKVRKSRGSPSASWKPAPSYFAAAMIPFFLLAWLLATASPQAKQAVVDYFHSHPEGFVSGGGPQK